MDTKEKIAVVIFAIYTIGIGALGYGIASKKDGRDTKTVEQGFAIPSKLEIIAQNLDERNKLPETYLKYNGKSYALTLDGQGNPKIQSYEFKPVEVKPAEILLK